MMYSICLLDQGDFEGTGSQMPSGTGIDNSVVEGDEAASCAEANIKQQHRKSKTILVSYCFKHWKERQRVKPK
jgi:hypothetical protein